MLALLTRLSRLTRLFLLLTAVIALPTLFFLYPSRAPPHSPEEPYAEYEAGGIDSPHWRTPKKPIFEKEEARWEGDEQGLDASCVGDECVADKVVDATAERKGTTGGGSHGTAEMVQEHAHGPGMEDVLAGGVIMPKLGNETAKAELGRAAWRVLHLMTLRYPDEPTPDDRAALKSYFHLFSRLYPCGECAAEFQALLKEYPPQTSSRKSASLWLCHVHNLVNARLGKEEFDCLTLDATYDCGCGDETVGGASASEASQTPGTSSADFIKETDVSEDTRNTQWGSHARPGAGEAKGAKEIVRTDEGIFNSEFDVESKGLDVNADKADEADGRQGAEGDAGEDT